MLGLVCIQLRAPIVAFSAIVLVVNSTFPTNYHGLNVDRPTDQPTDGHDLL